MVKDLTTGNPWRHIIELSIPLFIGSVFSLGFSLTDTWVAGRYIGVDALAAVGSTNTIIGLILGFVYGTCGGLSIIAGQRFGAKDDSGLRKSVTTSLAISLIISLLAIAISVYFTKDMLTMLNTPEDIFNSSSTYMTIIMAGSFSVVFYVYYSSIMRALGDNITPLVFIVISCFINGGLDIFAIVYLNGGVAGLAWATVLTQTLSVILCIIAIYWKFPMLRLHKEDWKIPFSYYWQHLRIALPIGFYNALTCVGLVIVQHSINGFGTAAVAGISTAGRVSGIASLLASCFATAISAYTAQNYGARNLRRIQWGFKVTTILAVSSSLIFSAIVLIFSRELISFFLVEPDEEVIRCARTFLNIVCSLNVLLVMLFVLRNFLQAMGFVILPMISVGTELVIRVFVAIFFVKWWGFTGICWQDASAWIGAVFIMGTGYFVIMHKLKRDGIPDTNGLARRTEKN